MEEVKNRPHSATASAAFGLLEVWLTMDIEKTPRELVAILKRVIRKNLLF